MSAELKDCPFCGSKPTMKHIGNDHTKTRAVEVKCSNIECRVARTDKAFRNDHAWLTAVAVEGWNRRPALAASGGNAAPPDACPVAITDSSALNGIKWYVKPPEWLADGINLYFVPAKIVPASAPNAALVALKEACDLIRLEVADGVHTEEYRRGMAALSAAGQEVKS